MTPRLSIITPTLLRWTLPRMLQSVQQQTNQDYEHLVGVDRPETSLTSWDQHMVRDLLVDPHVRLSYCHTRHGDYGHSCRYRLSREARGDYLLYLDDDDYLADEEVLAKLARVTAPWAIFPVLREGHYFFSRQPVRGSTTLSSFIVRRELGQFPDPLVATDPDRLYQMDADLIERLLETAGPPEVLEVSPLVVIPHPSAGIQEPLP